MKYKVGDKVRIRSKEWYESHKNKFGKIWTVCLSGEGTICFDQDNAKYCGKEVIIFSVEPDNYVLRGIPYEWTDEMIEGLVEGESLSQEEFAEQWSKFDINKAYNKILEEKALKQYEVPTGSIKIWDLPEGYQFTDENGNVINATKIVLEKKKKEYPKTYEECCKIMDIDTGFLLTCYDLDFWKGHLLTSLQKLLICRDAYWKIAGEEMGLGKPWEPSDSDYITGRYCIFVHSGNIICDTPAQDCILTFPTPEMRDAFYENFKELIESVKELL